MSDTTVEEKQSVENYINSLLNQENKESSKEYSLPKNYLNSLSKNSEITDEELKSLLDDTSSVDLYMKKVEDSSINFNNDIQSYSESVQNYIQLLKEKSSNKDRQNKLDKIGGALKFLAEKRELSKKGPIQNKKVEQYIQEVQDYKFSIADYGKDIQQYTEMLSGKANALSIFDPEIPIESNEPTEEEKFEEEINEEIVADKKEKVEGSITEIVEKDEEEQKLKKEEIIKDSKEQVKDYVSKISDAQKKIKEEQKFLDPESANKTDYEKKLEKKIEKLEKKLNSLTNQIGALKSGGSNWGDILKINESFIPSQNNYYDIGSPEKRWRNLYLTGNTIIIGETSIRADGNGSIEVASATTNSATGYVTIGEYGTVGGVDEETVNTIVTNLLIEVPGAFEVLNQLNDALANDSNLASEITTLISEKANTSMLSSVAISGSFTDLSDRTIVNLSDVNSDNLTNSAILFYNSSTQTFEFSTDIDQDEIKINGGTF